MSDSSIEKNSHLWQRDEHDWYVEGEECTRALLRVEKFIGGIWDPACGGGNIVRSAIASGYRAYGSDVVDRAGSPAWFRGVFNFLEHDTKLVEPNIITNPPFFRAKGTEAFIRKAISIATGKVAVFTDIKFLAGSGRAKGLFADHPPTRVYSLSPRPSCPPGEYLAAGNKAGGGTADWIWIVFDLTAPRGATSFHWLSTAEAIAA